MVTEAAVEGAGDARGLPTRGDNVAVAPLPGDDDVSLDALIATLHD
jgi:hypothetical protein